MPLNHLPMPSHPAPQLGILCPTCQPPGPGASHLPHKPWDNRPSSSSPCLELLPSKLIFLLCPVPASPPPGSPTDSKLVPSSEPWLYCSLPINLFLTVTLQTLAPSEPQTSLGWGPSPSLVPTMWFNDSGPLPGPRCPSQDLHAIGAQCLLDGWIKAEGVVWLRLSILGRGCTLLRPGEPTKHLPHLTYIEHLICARTWAGQCKCSHEVTPSV